MTNPSLLTESSAENINSRLSLLVTQIRRQVNNFEELQDEYQKLVFNYLKDLTPFHWNQNSDLDINCRFEMDVRQYHLLIKYSLNADSFNILDYWGFEFPFGDNYLGLARDIDDYINAFSDFLRKREYDEKLTLEEKINLKKYYGHLLGKLEELKDN